MPSYHGRQMSLHMGVIKAPVQLWAYSVSLKEGFASQTTACMEASVAAGSRVSRWVLSQGFHMTTRGWK